MDSNGLDIIFFDAGETLVHPMPSFPELFSSCCADFGLEVDLALLGETGRSLMAEVEEKQRQGYTFTNDGEASRRFWLDFYRHLVKAIGYGDDEDLPRQLYEVFSRRENYGLYDDVITTLAELQDRGIRLGLISNFEAWLEDLLDGLGLGSYLEVMVISGNEGYEKPHPAIYAIALERAGLEAHRALHVGDSPVYDFAGAIKAGMQAVLLDRWGRFQDFQGERIGALAEIPALLASK